MLNSRVLPKYLTDNLVHRLLRVDLERKALTDLTPANDRLFLDGGAVHFDVTRCAEIGSAGVPRCGGQCYALPTAG